MVRYWIYVCIVFLLLLVSCGPPEALPRPETVLPKGSSRKVVPEEFIAEMGFDYGAGEVWIRCIDCKEDWDGLNQHVLNEMGKQGYTETTLAWLNATGKTANWSSEVREIMNKVLRAYTSEIGYAHIMLIDLKQLKEMGAQLTTSGDFLVLAVIDDLKQY